MMLHKKQSKSPLVSWLFNTMRSTLGYLPLLVGIRRLALLTSRKGFGKKCKDGKRSCFLKQAKKL